MSSKSNKWVYSYIALGLTWGSSFMFIELSLQIFTAIGVAFWRGFFGSLALLTFVYFSKQKIPSNLNHWLHFLVVALLLNSIPGFLFAYGQNYVTSSMAGLINGTTPLMTVLVIGLAFREQKLSKNQILGIVIGFIGIILISEVLNFKSGNSLIGIAALLLATFCYGIAYPYAKRYISNLDYSSTVMATSQVLCSAVVLLPFVLFFGSLRSEITVLPTIAILILGVMGTGFAYIWNFRNIKLAGSAIASTVTYVTPIVAVILGLLFLNENISLSQILGGIFVLFSASLVQDRVKLVKN